MTGEELLPLLLPPLLKPRVHENNSRGGAKSVFVRVCECVCASGGGHVSAVRGFTPSQGLAPLTPKEDHRSPRASHQAACLHRNFSRGLASESARVRGRALPRLDFACAAVLRKVLPSNFHVFVLLRRRSSSSDGA